MYFTFLQNRTLTVRPSCNLPVFCSWDMMTFHKKIIQYPLFCAPVLTNKIPGRKLIASTKYQTGTIGNDVVSHKALGILPALFIGGPLHACCIRKTSVHCCTVLLYWTTVLQYFKQLPVLHCSVPGTDSCTSVLYYCTTAVLFCTVLHCWVLLYWNCTDVLYYSTVVYQVLYYCCMYYTVLYCTNVPYTTALL